MSFRLRVFLLVSVVALGATGAAAALTLRQATHQVRAAATSGPREALNTVQAGLLEHVYRTGTWEGIAGTAMELSNQTGQRIRLVNSTSEVVVDTDILHQRTARSPGAVAAFVDPRPVLTLGPSVPDRRHSTLAAIEAYRADTLRTACLYRWDEVDFVVATGPDGLLRHSPTKPVKGWVDRRCRPGTTAGWLLREDQQRVNRCSTDACLQAAFAQQISEGDVAPATLAVIIGLGGDPVVVPHAGPTLFLVAIVAVLVVASALLISRRVVRPIGALIGAAHRIADGDRSSRVPIKGRDEIGQLARVFNQMADSVQSAEERQRRLIADVAHELRSPLTNLRGYLEALRDGVLRPDPDLFALLYDETILYQRLVTDLQDLALAEAGALVYHRVPADLVELVETARIAHATAAEAAGVSLTVEADGPIEAVVDPDRIRQALGNLITNAVRATPAGGSVILRAHANADGAVLEVADTGVGIEPEHLPLVFDRFWRADPARERDTGGRGLGLAIVRQIVRDHRGEVSARGSVGDGTTFELRLPLSTERNSGAKGRST
ncbi:HAMP domain-containing protein [Actinoplanes sp. TBRC 11911]|uniref:sensor histidine kinase n=1 Tax=Actinoplanes sp. TBRC 11911 TaxID=2729386 RepID=UPI00145CFBBE|nr:ATP-binding protein [Actinoplanes sp. TBRC 11911]NMO53391.1 HAMP domain-containing protein [Actinoplanes sp. TBRC 11911]